MPKQEQHRQKLPQWGIASATEVFCGGGGKGLINLLLGMPWF